MLKNVKQGKYHDESVCSEDRCRCNGKTDVKEGIADPVTPIERILQQSRQKMAACITVWKWSQWAEFTIYFRTLINRTWQWGACRWWERRRYGYFQFCRVTIFSTTLGISDTSTAHPSSTKWQNVHILPTIMSQVYQPSPSALSLPSFNKLVLQVLYLYNLSQVQHNLYLPASAIFFWNTEVTM